MRQVDLLWLPRAARECERAVLFPKPETDLATRPLPSSHNVRTSRKREIREHAENELQSTHPRTHNDKSRWNVHRIDILDNLFRYKLSEEDTRADHHEQSTIPVNQHRQKIEFTRTFLQREHEGEALDEDQVLEMRFSRPYLWPGERSGKAL